VEIDGNTRVIDVIRFNKNSIDAIASVNPHFRKLKNPILRKILAPRVNLNDAARIGKCEIGELFQVLTPLGFTVKDYRTTPTPKTTIEMHPKIAEARETNSIKILDVRDDLAQGKDPFQLIMNAVNSLPDNTALKIINTFEPAPLIRILTGKGFVHYVERNENIVETFLIKGESKQIENSETGQRIFRVPLDVFESYRNQNKVIKELDVRDMEMPMPMMTILEALETLESGESIYVQHKKVPQYLLPELEQRKCSIWISEITEGDVRLLILKQNK
jgi:uncharacterized protein (DUF2249 family)